jgi:two-component system response regulator MprA
MTAAQILVVDDEAAVRESLRRALALEGYDVELAADGAEALHRLDNGDVQPDAIVLDVLMPNVDGLETARRLRRAGNKTPILMLTARDEVEARVAGLDAGADDYVVKPFALAELLARLRALLRRTTNGAGEKLRFADLELDPSTREVTRDGDAIELDVPARRLTLQISDEELARRRAGWTPGHPAVPRGYTWLYQQHVLQADRGCDFDFLTAEGRAAGLRSG